MNSVIHSQETASHLGAIWWHSIVTLSVDSISHSEIESLGNLRNQAAHGLPGTLNREHADTAIDCIPPALPQFTKYPAAP